MNLRSFETFYTCPLDHFGCIRNITEIFKKFLRENFIIFSYFSRGGKSAIIFL